MYNTLKKAPIKLYLIGAFSNYILWSPGKK